MECTTTFVSCLSPHSLASTFWNQTSNSGRKWDHLATFSVFCCASGRSGKRKNGPKAAVAAVILRKSRREVVFALSLVIVVAGLACDIIIQPEYLCAGFLAMENP